jgi:hypothetical protein
MAYWRRLFKVAGCSNHDKNHELLFSYLDELIEKKENPAPRRPIGFKTNTDQSLIKD